MTCGEEDGQQKPTFSLLVSRTTVYYREQKILAEEEEVGIKEEIEVSMARNLVTIAAHKHKAKLKLQGRAKGVEAAALIRAPRAAIIIIDLSLLRAQS